MVSPWAVRPTPSLTPSPSDATDHSVRNSLNITWHMCTNRTWCGRLSSFASLVCVMLY